MKSIDLSRRSFIKNVSMAAGVAFAGASVLEVLAAESKWHLSSNSYSWNVYFNREKLNFDGDLDAGFKALVESGVNGFEPGIGSVKQLEDMAPMLSKHKVEIRSIYINSSLHEKAEAEKSVENIVAIAAKAKTLGTKIIVTNPNPIKWGGADNKNDEQLRTQAQSMNTLGGELARLGIKLAYHNHDIELRNAGREFHHMMVGTDPKCVTLCLDAHWVYRGCGNSSVALFDVLKLYGSRISELHIRQSTNNVWSETLGEGDLDYPALVKELAGINCKPHLVLEPALEAGTPNTMNTVDVFRRSTEYARKVFAPLA